MKSLVTATIFAAALFAGAGGQALAQGLDPSASDDPLDITADQLEVNNKACISIWTGNAEALQGKARLRADVLRAYLEPKAGATSATGTGACGELKRIEAEGKVFYVTAKDQRVRGDAGTYEASSDTVTLTGDVVAVQGQNVLRGSKMVFNSKTGEGRMVGGATGPNAKDRPRGVFYPNKKTEAAKP